MADQCYDKVNASAESHEQKADYLLRTGGAKEFLEVAVNYKKAISHLSVDGEKNIEKIKVLKKKMGLCQKVHEAV
jgi:hypothetical protein